MKLRKEDGNCIAGLDVLHIIRSENIGGAETMLLTLLKHRGAGCQVGIIVAGESPFTLLLQAQGYLTWQIRSYIGKTDVGFFLRLLRLLRRLRPRVIQSHIWYTNLYAGLCGKALAIPVISTFHSCHLIQTTVEKMLMQVICGCSNKIVMVSHHQKKHFGLRDNSGKIVVIPNGIDPPDVEEGTRHLRCLQKRKELDLGEKDVVILSVGNLRPIKGHVFLLRAIGLLTGIENLKLLLIGDGPLRGTLLDVCRALDIKDRVHFLGYRNDVPGLLNAANIFVAPSLSEGTSMAILEAMAAAKPIVASHVGGNEELLEDGKDGMLIAPASPEALAAAIEFLAKNRAVALQMGTHAQQRVAEQFSAERMARHYNDLYRPMLFSRS